MLGERGWGYKRGVSLCAPAQGVSRVGVVKKGAGGVKKGGVVGVGLLSEGGCPKRGGGVKNGEHFGYWWWGHHQELTVAQCVLHVP